MSVIYMQRQGDKLLISDREILSDRNGNPTFIGAPQFLLEATGLTIGDDISLMIGGPMGKPIREGECYKMVLKKWPIE